MSLKDEVHIASLVDIIGKQKEELQALRAWKEKARPFLLDELSFVEDILSESDPYDDPEYMKKEYENHAILTELLKEEE
jgi:hypothetical protein